MRGSGRAWALVAGLLLPACLSDARYACEDDLQCVGPDRAGVCAEPGWCAYSEPECRSGLRYSALAEASVAGACVPDGGTSTGMLPHGGSSSGTSSDSGCGSGGCSSSDGTSSGSDTGLPCEATCTPGPNVTEAICDVEGTCLITCEPPYEDCDGDPRNGCEVPVGVSAQCSMTGLDPDGCWTPYCGESSASDATNFGSYFCVSCSTCREPEAGTCSWCELATGQWYPTDPGCECGDFLGAVCVETPA